MKYLTLVVVLALGAAVASAPRADPPAPYPSVSHSQPPVAVCSVEEGSGRSTNLSVLSTLDGPVRFTAFASGEPSGIANFRTGPSGAGSVAVVDIAAVGVVGGLVEMPSETSTAGTVIAGSESLAAEACAGSPAPLAVVAGGSTVSGERFQVHLMNPYAGDAVVELSVVSETGLETNDRFQSVIVPSRASTLVDLAELIPGRETVTVAVETLRGNVVVVGRQVTERDTAIWHSVTGTQDSFVPVAAEGVPRVLLVSPLNADVEYQVDLYGPEGFEEAYSAGTLPARGQVWLELDELAGVEFALRVVSTGPVVSTLWVRTDGGVAATPGTETQATRWFVPGAGSVVEGRESLVLVNTGIETSEVRVRALRENGTVRSYELGGDEVLEVVIDSAGGYLIESTGPVVVAWTALRAAAVSVSMGVPIPDG